MTFTHKCPRCDGTGRAPLSKSLERIVAICAEGHPTVREIYDRLPEQKHIVLTATYRRVERLLKMGVIRKVAKSNPARYELAKEET